MQKLILLLSLLGLQNIVEAADSVVPPQDPRQSITYWQSHRVAPDNDPGVAQAHSVFATLLRAWDDTRLAPSLTVVKSSAGPWAASLADGNILLSHAAIKTVKQFGAQRGRHLLAFVLAHELAHQRADDLWHQRFFRLTDMQSSSDMQQAVKQSLSSANSVLDFQQQEAQADHDALIVMSSVGYDPFQIVDHKDFFTQWVESIWQSPCTVLADSKSALAKRACAEAQNRALRTQAQLSTVASQATLYELGVQRFIAGQYQEAHRFFTAYGREYPSRAVYTALGLTHLARAMSHYGQLSKLDPQSYTAFHFPLLLDASPNEHGNASGNGKRGTPKQLSVELQKQTTEAIEYFEKARRLNPQHRYTQLLIATCYVLERNTFMARGILQGKYLPQFGSDPESLLLLAIVSAMENKTAEAQTTFAGLLKASEAKSFTTPALPRNVFLYSLHRNFAALATADNNPAQARELWMSLAKRAKNEGDSLLFRLAIGQLEQQQNIVAAELKDAPTINQLRLGEHLDVTADADTQQTAIWLDGEQLDVLRLTNGARFVVDSDRAIIGAWQSEGIGNLNGLLSGDSADRPYKLLGLPSRQQQLSSGQYLAYDQYGVAVQIVDDHVKGWFLYTTNE